MIEALIDEGKMRLKVDGTVAEILASLTIMIREIYVKLSEEDEDVGDSFRYGLEKSIEDGIPFVTDPSDLLGQLNCKEIKNALSGLSLDETKELLKLLKKVTGECD